MATQGSPLGASALASMREANELLRSGNAAAALAIYENVRESVPDNYALRVNFAQCLKRLGRWPDAITQFEMAFELHRKNKKCNGKATIHESVGTYQLTHLIEQLDYLSATNQADLLNDEDRNELIRLKNFMCNSYGLLGRGPLPAVTPKVTDLILGCPHRIALPPPISIINANATVETIQAGPDGDLIYVVDDIFDLATLSALRNFLTVSTIWFDERPDRGYLGAHLHDGLASALIRDVATAIRKFACDCVGTSVISQVWAFKYGSVANGIDVHADQADTNVNIWLTGEHFNFDSTTGGMTIYGARAPENWTFKAYNASPDLARRRLEAVRAPEHKIAYRSNRAAIFPSRLFHRTDPVNFRGSYAGRRVNLTIMLDRATHHHS
jgi:hypothetical protein